jgi:hypothetical protein
VSRQPESKPEPPAAVGDGSPGSLTTPSGQRLPVRVARRNGDVLLLALMLDGDGELTRGPLLLEVACAQGIVRLRGEAVLEQRDLVRFNVIDPADVVQRRNFVRVVAPQPVAVVVGEYGRVLETHAIDVSGGGMLLRGPETLELDDRIRFLLHLDPDQPPIKGIGRVVRASGNEQRAIVFERIGKHDRERLIHFIFDRQRAELAKLRGGLR